MTAPIWSRHPQGSAEWLRERCGMLTASRMAEAMDFLKNGQDSAARKRLKLEIAAERLTGTVTERYVTPAMDWGLACEAEAKDRYEQITGRIVQPCGFAVHGEIPYFGASPDGLVGEDGLIEVKCPTTATYVEWILDGGIPERYKPQLLAQLAVTGRHWVDFFVYDPRVTIEEYQCYLRRFEPEPKDVAQVEEHARRFLAEVDELIERVTRRAGEQEV